MYEIDSMVSVLVSIPHLTTIINVNKMSNFSNKLPRRKRSTNSKPEITIPV